MESPGVFPESPMGEEDIAYPCKGCGEILEEGKAFELAGNRWHINCFRCNTCRTLLDSDANLLLLGDGSLICNNCTYSCSSCGNKIEDLAILTGDQAFCATCFKCRNCKKKIENLRYARTSQGIFCMDCHDSLMARRRKKTARNATQRSKTAPPNVKVDKSLPALPPGDSLPLSSTPDTSTPPSEAYSEVPTEVPPRNRGLEPRLDRSNGIKRSNSPAARGANIHSNEATRLMYSPADNLVLPAETFKNKRGSFIAPHADDGGGEEFSIPLAFDPTPPIQQSPQISGPRGAARVVDEPPRDYFTDKSGSISRKVSTETQSSPHIAYQEKGRQPTGDVLDNIIKRREVGVAPKVNGSNTASPLISENGRPNQLSRESSEEKFKLQEVPKHRRGPGSRSNSRDEVASRMENSSTRMNGNDNPALAKLKDTSRATSAERQGDPNLITPRPSHETGRSASIDVARPTIATQSPLPPKRGDSLETRTGPRKDVGNLTRKLSVKTQGAVQELMNPQLTTRDPDDSVSKLSSGKSISKPVESPKSKNLFDTAARYDGGAKDPFSAPRAPPAPPVSGHDRNASISTMQSDTPRIGEYATSPSLPRYSGGGEFTLDEDMARIMGHEENHESFLKRVSNSVRHGRSFSDKGMKLAKEPKWPKSPVTAGQDISSPNATSPEARDELAWYKNELRRERQKNLDRDRKIQELESLVNSTAEIQRANTELTEKRSTMVVLDAQKELIVRELEVLTDHIAESRRSGQAADFAKFTSSAIRAFGEELRKLKDSFAPKIEEALQTKANLAKEIADLVQMKEKSFQEFEQLSLKNAQLAELNNNLVHQIQNIYKSNSDTTQPPAPTPNGLGIYSHHKAKSTVSVESKETRPHIADMSLPASQSTVQQEEAEPITVIQGPQVVNIRKGQPKKFNWKKGGSDIAKGVTKGLKGAFSSTQQSYAREMQFAETGAYGTPPPSQEYSSIPKTSIEQPSSAAAQKGFGGFFIGGNPKATKPSSPWKLPANDSSSALAPDPSTTLYGSDLEQRAEFEKNPIPFIITRCIEEVESRGMDVEGIYRKSGGNSQILIVKEGFEKNPLSFDISDPDLDIHAVTSGLKQYLRKLPTPLITYEVYDKILESMAALGKEAKVNALRQAITELPQVHQDVLEYLVFHLQRVKQNEKENLMTSMNIAVVFAPTIMRPESLTREMTDTQKKNEAVQFIVDNCQSIFLVPH